MADTGGTDGRVARPIRLLPTVAIKPADPVATGGPAAQTWLRLTKAGWMSLGLLIIGVAIAAATSTGDGFRPRVPTIDALAGVAAGAFLVDRALTFIPPWSADDHSTAQRESDIESLRWGWGAIIGALFVLATGLRAVAALTGQTVAINPHVDRAIAVLAIAGGVKRLGTIKNALNPTGAEETSADPDQLKIDRGVYLLGVIALGTAALIAVGAAGDRHAVELLGPSTQGDGTVTVIVRFGPLLLASAIIQQVVEHSFASSITGPGKPVLTAAASVVLGVIAAWLTHVYLLHNLGFFDTKTGAHALSDAAAAHSWSRYVDVLGTGLIIASGTSPLHDLITALGSSKTA